jgi:hypothetical protein
MQAHHIIPAELEDHPLIQRAISAGWDIDGKNNGILLPESPELAKKLGLPQHRGSHPRYNDAAEDFLGALSNIARDMKMSDDQVAGMIDYATMLIARKLQLLPSDLRIF